MIPFFPEDPLPLRNPLKPEVLYNPELGRKQTRRMMGAGVDLLTDNIRFGCKLMEEAPRFAGNSNRFAGRHLYRMALGTLDGVDLLLTSGSGNEARVLLRKAVETTAQLMHLALHGDDQLLGTAFMIEMFTDVEAESGSSIAEDLMREARLFIEAHEALRNARKRVRHGHVRWYSINDGPIGIRKLVIATRQPLLVEIWDNLSRSVHGSLLTETVERRPAALVRALVTGGPMLSPLRSSAFTTWRPLLVHADLLWMLATMAVVVWEPQGEEPLFTFNRKTRLPRWAALGTEAAEHDLICALERLRKGDDPPPESAA